MEGDASPVFRGCIREVQSFPCIKMVVAMKAANPNWKQGQKFDTSILDNVTRESVEATLVKNGNRLVRNSIDVSV